MPEALILIVSVLFLHWEGMHQDLASGIRLYPYAVVVVGAILSWRFHHSRILLALLILAIADRSLALSWTGSIATTEAGKFTFQMVAILLPLNLAALAILPERDTLSPEGIWRVGVVLLQVIVIFLLKDRVPGLVVDLLDSQHGSDGILTWTTLGVPGLIVYIAGFVTLVIRLAMKTDAINRGFFWALIATFIALNMDFGEFTGTFLFATAGLILVVAVIEASYSMAYEDGLTGLPSRRALNQAMTRLGGSYTIAMVDVDHFKRFNDEHGHDVGDQVLRKVASELRRVTGGGKSFRYGGEEFAVLFPRRTTAQTLPHLERLRQRIGNSRFTLRGENRPMKKPKHPMPPSNPETLSITVSIGASQRGDHYDKPADVIRRADEALYKAKDSGRNRVKVADDFVSPASTGRQAAALKAAPTYPPFTQ